MPYATLRYEVSDVVASIALDQAETRTALSDAVLGELLAAFAQAREDHVVRCVVLALTHVGIVNRVVAPAELDAAVADWAQRLSGSSPLMMRLGTDALARTQDMALVDALELLRAQLTVTLAGDDAREGVAAFFERREPRCSGR
ncbi:MAG: enoyl-CoA hydratase-related protein [Solirubrobacteraceae bacterium]